MRRLALLVFAAPVAVALSIAGCGAPENSTTDPAAGAPDAGEVTVVTFANESCPVMGGSPTPELTRQWNGKTIGFCCDGCPEKWDELSEEEKEEKFAEAAGSEGTGEPPTDHGHDDHDHGEHEASSA